MLQKLSEYTVTGVNNHKYEGHILFKHSLNSTFILSNVHICLKYSEKKTSEDKSDPRGN